ncbi:tryptophan 2,3-dioxygenase [uncultured Brevundimonas sp.]|uniref:tryptophan 2,3-dioxygenase n=1 Tax=uncultured Brevundimonas sp. TaxID=213418 RepID=UPI0026358B45|nr:tryptophan 2,3-dioxygenase [uncultured Brevundimonas sp.]
MTKSSDQIRSQSIENARHEPQGITYAGYLALDELLSAQKPRSDEHDEMLFVIIHQTKELWLKQILHEVALAQSLIRAGNLVPAYKSLARVSRIQSVMTQSWDILATMTPADYLRFRGDLGSSSGFQSDQFRRLETMLGLKDPRFLRFHAERPEAHAALVAALEAPSLYDDALRQLALAGVSVPQEVLERDVSQTYEPHPGVEAAWLEVYRNTEKWWPLYQLAEKLVDLDDALLTWRHKHVVTVERIIGRRQGTGGTDGVGYLVETLKRRCFPELWSLRTKL